MKIYGLLGKNIDYSFSRKYFSEKFRSEKIDAEYHNFDLPEISEFPSVLKQQYLHGLNVTIPYKQSIIPYLDHLAEDAKKIGAVNTIKFEKDGKLCGYNTDFYGFTESLKPHLQNKHSKALILGTGGASKAIAYAFQKLGIAYKFVSRNPESDQYSYAQLDKKILEEFYLIVNCTPLGTFPKVEIFPEIPFQYFNPNHLIFDLIYNPAETQLMKLAAKNGAKTVNGLRMLELQAEKAWEIWNS